MRTLCSSTRQRVAGMLLVTAGLMLAGCQGPASTSPAQNPNGPELFGIPQNQASHVQVLTVQMTAITRLLRLTGTVAYNSFRTAPVISQISGPVSRVVAFAGQHVHKGQPMLYVSSPDYSQLRSSYLKARDAAALAHQESLRAKDLYAHHAAAERDLLAAESAEVQAQADLTSAEAALKVLGITDLDSLVKAPSSFEIPVLAPIEGEVVEQSVSGGQLLQAGSTQCFTISDIGNVWVLVNVYQKDLPYVHVGDAVTIQTDTYPNAFHGRISYLAASLDPSSRTLQARIDTRNPRGELKKDMYVVATLEAGKIKNALTVPDAAILRDSENQPFVYAELSPNQFGRRGVTLGENANGQTEITAGLKPGDRVIGDGSLFLQFANSLQR